LHIKHENVDGKLRVCCGDTLAVATCPSVSTLSIVPVGKYGRMKVNERAMYLQQYNTTIRHKHTFSC